MIDETIYQGPFTFNVCTMYVRFLRVRFQCPRSAKKNVCHGQVRRGRIARGFCRRSTYTLSIANTWPKCNAFSSHLRVRLRAGSDVLVTTLCVYNARRRSYISLTSYVSYRYVHTYIVWPKEGHARRSTLRNRCTDLFYVSNEKSYDIHFCEW